MAYLKDRFKTLLVEYRVPILENWIRDMIGFVESASNAGHLPTVDIQHSTTSHVNKAFLLAVFNSSLNDY